MISFINEPEKVVLVEVKSIMVFIRDCEEKGEGRTRLRLINGY